MADDDALQGKEPGEAHDDAQEIRAGVRTTSFQVGKVETVEGDNVYLVVNAHEPDAQPLSIPAEIAEELGRELARAAEEILDETPTQDHPN